MTTIYRNYLIARLGDRFVAQSRDDECILVSVKQERLRTAIDDLWASLDRGAEPAWFSGSNSIDLDTFGPESVPSSSDPPAPVQKRRKLKVGYLTFGISAVAVSAPIALLLDILKYEKRVDVMLAVGVCASAIAFGRNYALLLSVLALIVNNLCCVEPILVPTIPTFSEWLFFAINIAAAIGIPELLKLRCLQGSLGIGQTEDT
jgi:K+-sensing histidine kinase KdpD